MNKKEFRNYFLKKRLTLTNEEVEYNSTKIISLFLENFNLKKKSICTFLPISTKNEINTLKLIELSKKHDFDLYTTKWNLESNELSIHKITSHTVLTLNSYNIPEPTNTNPKELPYNISIVLVPLLCFDKIGHRIGYGKGVYDQFLAGFNNSRTIFIGLSIYEPINQISDTNEFDIKLNYCITPNKVYHFEK